MVIFLSFFTEKSKCAISESDLFPFDNGEDKVFQFGDDDFVEHDFKVPFIFFNKTYSSVFISGNGQVSFGAGKLLLYEYNFKCIS